MDSRQIRERGQFGSKRNIGRNKIKTKNVEQLFGISTTKKVKIGERLRQDMLEEFRGELDKLQKLRKHTKYVYEKDFQDTINRVNKKIGDKLTPVQERHLRALFFAQGNGTQNSSRADSSRLSQLKQRLDDDSTEKPFRPVTGNDDEESGSGLEKIREHREEKSDERKNEDKDNPPDNLPIAA